MTRVCALALVAACGGSDPASVVAHDACAPLTLHVAAPTAIEQTGITDALALWRDHGLTVMTLREDAIAETNSPDAIDVRFEDAAETFHGMYDPPSASILINRDLTTGHTPDPLAIVIAHELGHVFGLVHIDPHERLSLMNADNLTTPPTDGDQRALEALWGVCATSLAMPHDARHR